MAKRPTHFKRVAAPRKLPCDKWTVGMVDEDGKLSMFSNPRIYPSYSEAVLAAEDRYRAYPTRHFVVFAKVCIVGPSRPPILKQEYLA